MGFERQRLIDALMAGSAQSFALGVGPRFVGAEGIAVEIEAQLPDGSVRHTTNHYRFDETGKILALGVYARG